MNKLVVIMSCATFMFTAYCMPWTFAQEQIDRKPPMRKVVDPETSAREITDKMKDELELTDKQYKKVYKLNLKEAKAMTDKADASGDKGAKPGMGGRGMRTRGMRPEGERPGARPDMENGVTDSRDIEKEIKNREGKMEKEMKKILDDNQYEKWQDMMTERKEHMKRELDLRRQRMELGLPDE